jgi:RNA polymerase sigma-70 factor (ECF subfamily)
MPPPRDGEGGRPEQLRLREVETIQPDFPAQQGSTAPDCDLILRHCAGDPNAFESIYARHRSWLQGFLVNCGLSPEDAEEACNDVFTQLHRHAASLEVPQGRVGLRPWLVRVAKRKAIDRHRKSTGKPRPAELPEDGSDSQAGHDLEESLETTDFVERLEKRVAGQIDRGKAVLRLKLMGLSQEQIGLQLAMSRDQVRERLTKIRGIAVLLRAGQRGGE